MELEGLLTTFSSGLKSCVTSGNSPKSREAGFMQSRTEGDESAPVTWRQGWQEWRELVQSSSETLCDTLLGGSIGFNDIPCVVLFVYYWDLMMWFQRKHDTTIQALVFSLRRLQEPPWPIPGTSHVGGLACPNTSVRNAAMLRGHFDNS